MVKGFCSPWDGQHGPVGTLSVPGQTWSGLAQGSWGCGHPPGVWKKPHSVSINPLCLTQAERALGPCHVRLNSEIKAPGRRRDQCHTRRPSCCVRSLCPAVTEARGGREWYGPVTACGDRGGQGGDTGSGRRALRTRCGREEGYRAALRPWGLFRAMGCGSA